MGATAYDRLRQEVLGHLDRERVDPAAQPDRVRVLVARTVADYQRTAEAGSGTRLRDAAEMAARLEASITAFGPLTHVLTSPHTEEVFIEGSRVTWMDRRGRLQGLDVPTTEEENRAVVERLLAPTGRGLDTRNPIVQARVLDGAARLSAAIPPVAEALSATVRRHARHRLGLSDLVATGSLDRGAAALLALVMRGWSSVVVSGQPGAGKTSLLAAMLASAPADRCVRVCEEIRELTVPLTHGSYYETRPPSASGEAEIDLRSLLRFCLGMRCELLVVGEVRGAEAFELTRAVNAGCGFACTVHANSGRDALEALTNAAIMAGEHVPERLVRRVFANAIDLVVHVDRVDHGDRHDDVHRTDRTDHTEHVNGADGAGRLAHPDLPRPPQRGGQTPPGGTDGGSAGRPSATREVREIVVVMPSLDEGFATEPLFTRPDGPGTPLRWTGVLPPRLERLGRWLPPGQDLRAVLAGDLTTSGAVA